MRMSFVALIGLAALNGKFGADATAIPNDLALSSSSTAVRSLEAFTIDMRKRAVAVPNLPRAPVDPAPEPEPGTPDPGTPDPDPSEPGTSDSDTSDPDISKPDAPDVVTPEPVTPEQPIKPEPVKPERIGSKPNDGRARDPRYLPDDMSFKEPNPCQKVKRGEKVSRVCSDVKYKGDAGLLFDTRASEAMAKLASGEVHVLLPSNTKGTEWAPGTVWDVNEYPNLGAAVTKIIRVNPDNDDEEEIPKKS
ncbi:hypothetical protein OIDMADRAFT_27565 [Oidiodendron maius Zn]|uniref:Uncharacterized protein n=1 Tax=Oidiodendron maius (strain Zn) TaxID=913774 RepID=A0A0C3HJ83_OIDMZ|nr:hypothetical protein OIDMADRAFT_27565 [Oidiodendron maius Zn]